MEKFTYIRIEGPWHLEEVGPLLEAQIPNYKFIYIEKATVRLKSNQFHKIIRIG